jgi:hypothetical protein
MYFIVREILGCIRFLESRRRKTIGYGLIAFGGVIGNILLYFTA